MEIQHIPKTFWHSLSIAVLTISSGLTYVAYNSSELTLELANAKISLNSNVASTTVALNNAVNNAKSIKVDAEKAYEEVLARNVMLEQQIESLKGQIQESKKSASNLLDFSNSKFNNSSNFISSPPNYQLLEKFNKKPTPKALSFKEFDQNVLEIEETIKALESLNKQFLPIQ